MLSDDQRKLATTAIAVVAGCALAWYLLVEHNPPRRQVQVAQQIKRGETKPRRPPFAVGQTNIDEQALRPLPPPMPVIKPRPKPTSTQPVEGAKLPMTE